MANWIIRLHVLKPGERAEELLSALAARLGRAELEPNEAGNVFIWIQHEDSNFDASGSIVRALEEIAPNDWDDYLFIKQ